MAETFLARIVVATRARLAERMAERSIDEVRAEAERQPPALDFAAALRPTDGGIRAIAEIKRASPSKGTLRKKIDPEQFATTYAENGAAAISVLTEEDHFRGSLADLRAVKATTAVLERHVPVLRKDFIIDAYQVVEARAAGADSYLLIAALLEDATLGAFIQFGRELGMEPLVEVHDAEEARRAVAVGARVIGVNARDLRTFTVDTTLLRDIRELIPPDHVVVAESGLAFPNDVVRMRGYGADAVLMGEVLVRQGDPGEALQWMLNMPSLVKRLLARPTPVIKLCGMRTPADALAAYETGADLIGLVFAPGKRQVTRESARHIVDALPADAMVAGVFVNESPDAIAQTITATGINVVQISAYPETEGPGAFSQFGVPIIIVGKTETPFHSHSLLRYGLLPLLDSTSPGAWGGTGQVGDWERAAAWAKQYPIILAGGLNPDNVGDAIRAVQPWGVDVSSGIEGPDGQKDPSSMRAFVEAVRGATETVEHEGHEGR